MLRRWMARQGWALCSGFALTLAAVFFHLAGRTAFLERLGYDYLVRSAGRVPASDRIVLIDIDDQAVSRVDWPWPRDLQADLIRALHELGAERIAVDFVWAEPQGPQVRLPIGRYDDLGGQLSLIGDINEENVVYPDHELAQAIAEAGCVYLTLYAEDPPAWPADSLHARMAGVLRDEFGLTAAQLATKLSVAEQEVTDILAGVKQAVAEHRVRDVLTTRPAATAREAYAAILPTALHRETPDRADILAAYSRERGRRILQQRCAKVPAFLHGRLPLVARILPPLDTFAVGARGAGSVGFCPDTDGSTRWIPLLADAGGMLVEQLGFALARDLLNIQPEDLSLDAGGNLIIAAGGQRPTMQVQLDNAQLLVNWHVAPAGWAHAFVHLPATQLLTIVEARQRIRQNHLLRDVLFAQAVRLVRDEPGYRAYRDQVNALITMKRQLRAARLGTSDGSLQPAPAAADPAQLSLRLEREQEDTQLFIDEQWAALSKEPDPNNPEIASDYRRFSKAHRLLHEDVSELDRINERIAADQQASLKRLRPMIEGKICIVGYTATAVADMVTTPADRRMPGVMVHANVLNSFLVGRFRTWAPRWVQALAVALAGILVTLTTVTRGPRTSFLMLVLAVPAGLIIDFLLFRHLDYWFPLATALTGGFVIWAIVVLLRYLITDRQKRHFSEALSQYVSPAVARSIANAASSFSMAPVSGAVSCFFSDLAGFTTMSERLGPDGTRAVLNPYLEAMSGVLHRHQALINKFIGDGIFAFFNPPILPCPQHQLAACEAALDCHAALRELPPRQAGRALAQELARLRMRIGLASGPVFVGDYGSHEKLDYTCMGDTVNLAARLESANKAFGSEILIAGSTYDAVAGRYACRPFGRVQVKGQTVATRIYALLGRSGEVDGELLRLAELSEEALTAFALRDWAAATSGFEACLRLQPGDLSSLRYLALIRAYVESPPPQEWSAAIELTEK